MGDQNSASLSRHRRRRSAFGRSDAHGRQQCLAFFGRLYWNGVLIDGLLFHLEQTRSGLVNVSVVRIISGGLGKLVGPSVDDGMAIDVVDAGDDALLEFVL